MVVCDPVNRLYLTGLRSTAGMLVILPGAEPIFLTDFRYLEMARKVVEGARVQRMDSLPDQLGSLARRLKWKTVGFEGSLSMQQWRALREAMPGVKDWVESEGLVLKQRARKSRAEQKAIARSVALCDEVFRQTVGDIEPGMTEWEIRRTLRSWVDHLDADQESFDCIISAGANASKPHAHVTREVWKSDQSLLIDMGVRLNGYCSDMTRMVFASRPPAKLRAIYDVVLAAQLMGIAAVRAGRKGREVDAVARNYIEKKGYGKYFGHGLGHGVGLEIHEGPRLNQESDTVLEAGMVVTVEPGIYLPGVGGVRIEDVVIVREDGCEVLTKTTKEMILAG